MPNLLQIAITAGGGSIGNIATQVGDAFKDEFGGNSYITYHFRCRPSKSIKNISIKVGNRITFYFHIIWTRLFDAHGLASWYDTRKLIKFIKRNKIDIVHLHNIHGYYVNIKMLISFLKVNNIPVVWTIHDCWNFTGHCAHFYEVGCDLWKTGCTKCPYKNRYPQSVLLNRSEEMFKLKQRLFGSLNKLVLVPVSDWQCRMLQASFLGNKSIVRIYNGINTDIFKPIPNADSIKERYNLKGKFVVLGVATGWGPDKGTLDYIRLSQLLPEDVKIVLVGTNEEVSKQMPPAIMCLPRTNNQNELVELYSMADVLTSLSYQESMGLTPVEAMACGTPAIVYNNTAQPEVIDVTTGIVVETGNIEQTLNAILKIKESGKAYYSDACVLRVHNMFESKKCYHEYIQLYRKLLNYD